MICTGVVVEVHSTRSLRVRWPPVPCVDESVDGCNGQPVTRYRVRWTQGYGVLAAASTTVASTAMVVETRWEVGVAEKAV